MDICGPKGRDCIEGKSSKSFNCSATCEGIYAGVQWVGKKYEDETNDEETEKANETGKDAELKKLHNRVADLERKLRAGAVGEKGEELDKEKYKKLIAEYRKFKTMNVKHFRFNSAKDLCAFGKSRQQHSF